MDTSANGRQFIRAKEGNPLTAYLDPVNIPTIGVGFTERSAVVRRMLGKIVPGKTKITAEQSDRIFAAMLDEEYEPPVESGMPGAKQHEFDAGVSVVFNLGPQAIDWQWAKLWRAGRKQAAAEYLATHYNTARGKRLPGLVTRREQEALILKVGAYPGIFVGEGQPRASQPKPHQAVPDPIVIEAQGILAALKLYDGKVDGWYGPKTEKAIRAYQSQHPHLVVDGILGKATLSQLRREKALTGDVGKNVATQGGGAVVVGGGAAIAAGVPWGWIVAGAVVILIAVAGYYLWRNRDILVRRMQGAQP